MVWEFSGHTVLTLGSEQNLAKNYPSIVVYNSKCKMICRLPTQYLIVIVVLFPVISSQQSFLFSEQCSRPTKITTAAIL